MKKIISVIVLVVVIVAGTVVSYATIYDSNVTPKQNEKQVVEEIKTPDPKPVEAREVEPPKTPTKVEREAAHMDFCATEYPTATKVWKYMRQELGWSEAVCAGVMGNIMAECGGQTLNIDPNLYDAATGQYYGICQWSAQYNGEVHGTSLDFQLKYLKGTVESEFSTFGYLYGGSGFGYESFKQIERPEDVALAFAMCYERCSAKTYYIREENALKAYKYFINY